MVTRLVILGFLIRRPLHGYEIKQMIQHVMGDWTDIAFGSIYFALKKLAAEGFVREVGTEREGARPSRLVYGVTDSGRKEFMRLLRSVWGNVERQFFTFDVGLSFMGSLPSEETKEHLRKRIAQQEAVLGYLDRHEAEQRADPHVPTHLVSTVFDHHRRHLRAELDWTKTLLGDMERGAFDTDMERLRGMQGEGRADES